MSDLIAPIEITALDSPPAATSRQDRILSAALFAAAAIALGRANQINNGAYYPLALDWLTAAICLSWAALFLPALRVSSRFKFTLLRLVVIAGLIFQAEQLLTSAPGSSANLASYAPLYIAVGLAAVSAAALAWPQARRLAIFGLLLAHFLMGVWMIHSIPRPRIDVFEVTRAGCDAFAHGRNPYAVDFPLIYTPAETARYYPPGFVWDGRVHFGYQYTPWSFFVAFAGHCIAGDFRYGNLAAIVVGAGLMAFSFPPRPTLLSHGPVLRKRVRVRVPPPGNSISPPDDEAPPLHSRSIKEMEINLAPIAAGIAAIFLFTPRTLFVIEFGWSEAAIVVCLGLTLFCAARFPRYLSVAVGLLLVSKQYMLLATPAVFLLLPRPLSWRTTVRFLLITFITGAMVSLPLILWDFRAFWHSAMDVQIKNPFRDDSLNYAAAYLRTRGKRLPPGLDVLAAGVAGGIAIWRAPRTIGGFAAAIAFIFFGFFAFAKQAFCNYYFFLTAALCCAAIGTILPPHRENAE